MASKLARLHCVTWDPAPHQEGTKVFLEMEACSECFDHSFRNLR